MWYVKKTFCPCKSWSCWRRYSYKILFSSVVKTCLSSFVSEVQHDEEVVCVLLFLSLYFCQRWGYPLITALIFQYQSNTELTWLNYTSITHNQCSCAVQWEKIVSSLMFCFHFWRTNKTKLNKTQIYIRQERKLPLDFKEIFFGGEMRRESPLCS